MVSLVVESLEALGDGKPYGLGLEVVELERLPKARCLATGYSCRSQVKRMEGEKLKHPLQALLELL